jgi:ferrochelatase
MSPEPATGIVCMAYGSPAAEADIGAYYTHIRGGRQPSSDALRELTQRYRAIGGSPLTEITRAQARSLSERTGMPAFVGMKHAAPFIAEAAAGATGSNAWWDCRLRRTTPG